MLVFNYTNTESHELLNHKGVNYFKLTGLPCDYYVLSNLIIGDIEDNIYIAAAKRVGDQWFLGFYTTDLSAINKACYGYYNFIRHSWKIKRDLFSY